MIHVRQKLDSSERRTCHVLGLARSTLQYKAVPKDDDALRLAMIRLAKQYGRYGYRKVAKLLRIEGWHVNHKKVERLWKEEGLQLPHRHRKRKRLYHECKRQAQAFLRARCHDLAIYPWHPGGRQRAGEPGQLAS
ncbi:MAG: IS3 family transposase [Geminicoccaceae bacterium]